MRLHLAAAGPRARALTARLGAGWINFFSDVPAAVAMLGEMQQAWGQAGQTKALEATAFVLGCVLEEGEPYDSPRAIAQAGPAPRCCCIARPMRRCPACPTSLLARERAAGGRGLCRPGPQLRAEGCAVSAEPPRPSDVPEAGGEALRHR
ncbi:hypothetical protein ACFQU2_31175 [Siccirubricoccus deserti]